MKTVVSRKEIADVHLAMDRAKILVVAHVQEHVQEHQNRLVVAVALVVVLATVGPVVLVVADQGVRVAAQAVAGPVAQVVVLAVVVVDALVLVRALVNRIALILVGMIVMEYAHHPVTEDFVQVVVLEAVMDHVAVLVS